MTSTQSVASIDSLEIIFDHFLTHIGRYILLEECWVLTAQQSTVYLHKNGLSPHEQKSNGIKSHDLGDQLISLLREITQPGSVFCNKAIFARVVWHVAPSC